MNRMFLLLLYCVCYADVLSWIFEYYMKIGLNCIKKIAIASCLLMVTTFFLIWTKNVFYYKDLPGKNIALREPNQKIDVLILGSSHGGVLNPCDMWELEGVSAYNSSTDGNSMKRHLYSLKMSLEYCDPQVVILETEGWWEEPDFYDEVGVFHYAFDTYPLTLEKIKDILEFSQDPEVRKELFFPMIRFHERWKELEEKDFIPQVDYHMGATMRPEISEEEAPTVMGPEYQIMDADTTYVEQIIEECRQRGIDIMLLTLPFVADEESQERLNALSQVAEEQGVQYINLINYPGVIDFKTDMNDSEHLNNQGSRKCSELLCQYIKKVYGVPDRRGDEEYEKVWRRNIGMAKRDNTFVVLE